jgi:outer membrane protein TolC
LAILTVILLACTVAWPARRIRLADAELPDSVLSLQECFQLARRHNADLRRAFSAVVATQGEEIESWGRFIPRLSLIYGQGEEDSSGIQKDESVRMEVRQRIAEFGRTTQEEFDRQDRERRAFYDQESEIANVFSSVRRTYFSLTIIDRQLASHDSLLAHYTERLGQAEDRLGQGIGLRTAVLTARLNQLEERERILRLQTDRRQTVARLKELLGLAVLPDGVILEPHEGVPLPHEDSCVVMALDRSTEIADKKAEVLQAGRALAQTGWDFVLGDISFSAGTYKGDRGVELQMSTDAATRQWAVDAVGTQVLKEASGEGGFFTPRDTALRYTASVEVSLPVFQGARRQGDVIQRGATYSQARAEMIATTREIEKRTRDAYYDYELNRRHLAIQSERIAIDQERYALAETQYELGRMSDEGLDAFRERLFSSQDAYFAQEFRVLESEEHLRALIRLFE